MIEDIQCWAARWGVPHDAMLELLRVMSTPPMHNAPGQKVGSEAAVQQSIRLAANAHNMRLFRNNTGAMYDKTRRLVRYGLANDSAVLSSQFKSSDLIGIQRHTVRPSDVGRTLGVFISIEVKQPKWIYTATKAEKAQLRWLTFVASMGGRAFFSTAPEDLKTCV